MQELTPISRSLKVTCQLVACALLWSFVVSNVFAQYSDDLRDIESQFLGITHIAPGTHEPRPIGNLGHIDTVVDLRGFIPMAFRSKGMDAFKTENMTKFRRVLVWYKVPTKKALLLLYSGSLSTDRIATDTTTSEKSEFAGTRFLTESSVGGETALWCKLAYDLAEKDSKRIFDQLVGGSFDAAEPTTVFFTQQSAFVLLNFKYTAFNVGDQGQALVALEFSRSLKRYKTLYSLYSTAQFNKSTREVFSATGPYVAQAIASIFTGQ